MENIAEQAGKSEELSHSFFLRVRDMINAEDAEGLLKEKVYLKLLRLTPHAQEGFVLTDFPNNVAEAEMLEQFRGGMNAFVHVSLPDDVLIDIEENKHVCDGCGRCYYSETIIDEEQGIRIDPFMPKDGHCHDCGSTTFKDGSDPISFERDLAQYKDSKEDLLGFYDHFVSLCSHLICEYRVC